MKIVKYIYNKVWHLFLYGWHMTTLIRKQITATISSDQHSGCANCLYGPHVKRIVNHTPKCRCYCQIYPTSSTVNIQFNLTLIKVTCYVCHCYLLTVKHLSSFTQMRAHTRCLHVPYPNSITLSIDATQVQTKLSLSLMLSSF